jgi:hypothetical protein
MSATIFIVAALCILSVAFAFSPSKAKFAPQVATSKTQVYEVRSRK